MQILSLILTSSVLIATASSCGGTKETESATTVAETSGTSQTDGEDSLEARQLVKDNLPDLDYFGASFFTLSCDENIYDTAFYEEETGNAIHDAVYKRDKTVEETLNIKFKHNQVNYADHESIITNSVLAGDDEYQLYLGQAIKASNLALKGSFLNWHDVNYIDFDQPWYNQKSNNELTINGRCYLLLGSMSISSLGYSYCMFYNKDRALDFNIPDIYDTVNKGQWTYEKLYGYTLSVYNDVNGNSIRDEDDFYGFATRPGDLPTFMWAFDQKIVTVEDDGSVNVTFSSEKTADIVEKMRKLYKENIGTLIQMTALNTQADFYSMAV